LRFSRSNSIPGERRGRRSDWCPEVGEIISRWFRIAGWHDGRCVAAGWLRIVSPTARASKEIADRLSSSCPAERAECWRQSPQ
jgi:hypothetical protein